MRDVATGSSRRARDKSRQLIYLDAFVPARWAIPVRSERGGTATDAGPRQIRRRLARAANPTPPDTPQADLAWLTARRVTCDQMFRDEAQAAERRTGGAAQLRLLHAHCTRRHVRSVCQNARKARPGWRYFEIDASHSPNVTAPESLMALLERIVEERV